GDVFFASVHGDPHTEYPYYLGYADERGTGAGEGANLNLPLPKGTGFARWREALAQALTSCRAWGAEALVVSLGVDTFEGGYAVAEVGRNTVNVLAGFTS
ncbi:MAG: histone deacetylase family protein, partial [Comamonadaceae bacterium]